MAEHLAFADDGPLQGSLGLAVKRNGPDWPSPVVWTSGRGADERHVYRFLSVSVGTEEGVPMYRFDRTLASNEQNPALEQGQPG